MVFLLLFIVGYHLSDGKSRYGRYQNYDKKCQLRLYAVPEFRVSNDIIDSDMRVRRQRRNDKSLSTIGKDDLKSFSLWKNLKGGNEGRGKIYISTSTAYIYQVNLKIFFQETAAGNFILADISEVAKQLWLVTLKLEHYVVWVVEIVKFDRWSNMTVVKTCYNKLQ